MVSKHFAAMHEMQGTHALIIMLHTIVNFLNRDVMFGKDGRVVARGDECSPEEIRDMFVKHDGRLVNLGQEHICKLLQMCGSPIAKGGFGEVYVCEYENGCVYLIDSWIYDYRIFKVVR